MPELYQKSAPPKTEGPGKAGCALHHGLPGRIAGTRELVIPGTPYVAAYLVDGDSVRACFTARRSGAMNSRTTIEAPVANRGASLPSPTCVAQATGVRPVQFRNHDRAACL